MRASLSVNQDGKTTVVLYPESDYEKYFLSALGGNLEGTLEYDEGYYGTPKIERIERLKLKEATEGDKQPGE